MNYTEKKQVRAKARENFRAAVELYLELDESSNLLTELQESAKIVGVSTAFFDEMARKYVANIENREEDEEED
jgi:hypothetical protein